MHREGHFFRLLNLLWLSQIILKIMMMTTTSMMMMIMTMMETIWVRKTCFVEYLAVCLRLTKRWHVWERHMCISSPKQEHVCLLYKLTRTIHNPTECWRRANVRNVSFTNSLGRLIYLINSALSFTPVFWHWFNLITRLIYKNTRVIQQLLACEEGRGWMSCNQVLRKTFAI